MATPQKNKAAPAKSLRTAAATAAPKKAAPALPKKAPAKQSPKKPAPTPVQANKKPAAAAKPKGVAQAAPLTKTIKKIAPPPSVPNKNLSKLPVKTAAATKPLSKPVAKTAAKPAAPEPKTPRFSKADLDQFKVELLAMRDRITGQSGSMRNDALQRTDEINPEEDGTDAFMRLQTLEQVSSQQQIIANIDEALRAIDKGTYGCCDMCGELINKPRLAVLPFAKNCIKCQSEMERANRPGRR
jgi:RNA polymerase-binding transcription factor DksA